jgi:hypothetical protein
MARYVRDALLATGTFAAASKGFRAARNALGCMYGVCKGYLPLCHPTCLISTYLQHSLVHYVTMYLDETNRWGMHGIHVGYSPS